LNRFQADDARAEIFEPWTMQRHER
jgi:hypothetical protein